MKLVRMNALFQRPGVFLFCTTLLFVLLLLTWLTITNSQRKLIEFKSLQVAGVVSSQATAARSLYSQMVVAKLKADGFSASSESDNIVGAVPIPAQFLKNLAHSASESSEGQYRVRPLSKWNISPEQGLKDDFQKWGWEQLEKQQKSVQAETTNWKPVYRFENTAQGMSLRYLYPDPASGASCVACHNNLEALPAVVKNRENSGVELGKVWKLNDLMGALEVIVPIEDASAFADTQTRDGILILSAVALAGLLMIGAFFAFDLAKTKAMTTELEYQANHDYLTSLPNRSGFEMSQQRLLNEIDFEKQSNAVMLLDLNDFKRINDTLGHEVGDSVLIESAKRIRNAVNNRAIVARLGGDEFAVMISDTTRQEATAIANEIAQAFDPAILVGEYRLRTRPSVGIAMMPDDSTYASDALRCADVAMYVAKRGGTDIEFYKVAEDKNQLTKLSIISDFKTALSKNDLELYYQPKLDVNRGAFCGVEALLRWKHPVHGWVSPVEMLSIAEQCGLIDQLTRWTFMTGLNQIKKWTSKMPELTVSINLSTRMLNNVDTAELILQALRKSGVDGRNLIVEVTESGMLEDPECAIEILTTLNKHRIRSSIDDFGTGYSSLAHLQALPVNELKLDRSFMLNLNDSDKNKIIIKAAIELSHNLGIEIVAEGVETKEVLDYLIEADCNQVQGYFISKPLPAELLSTKLPQLAILANAISRSKKDMAA